MWGVPHPLFRAAKARWVKEGTSYVARDGELVPRPNPDAMSGERYFSAAGGLMTTAEGDARFAARTVCRHSARADVGQLAPR